VIDDRDNVCHEISTGSQITHYGSRILGHESHGFLKDLLECYIKVSES